MRRQAATVGALAALGVAGVVSFAGAAHPSSAPKPERGGDSQCDRASVPAADSSIRDLRTSIRCLINEERAVHGLSKLTRHKALKTASQRHVKAMVDTGCLAHRCPGEDDLETRLDDAGYFDGAEAWRYAENTGCGISADAMVANWLDITYHRINILDKDFREVGVGVSQKRVTGRCDKGYATFAVVFGRRTPG